MSALVKANQSKLTLWLVLALLAILAAVCACHSSAAAGGAASPGSISSFILGPEDLPWDMVLWSLRSGPQITRYKFEALAGDSIIDELWAGPPTGNPGSLKSAHYSIRIGYAVTSSPEEAGRVALKEVQSYAVVMPEITVDEAVASFADRAWGSSRRMPGPWRGARIVFTRGYIIGDISMDHKDGFEPQLLFTLAARMGRRIDTYLTGRPEPLPVLPLAADQELGLDLEGAWKARDLGSRLWGAQATSVALYDTNGIPRSIPARRIGTDDFLVPLRYLAAVVNPRTKIKASGKEAETTIIGRQLSLRDGESKVRVGQRIAQLNRPVEFAEGQVLVPLSSFARQALGRRITWERRGAMMLGRFE